MDCADKLPPSPWYIFAPPRRYIFPPPLTYAVAGVRGHLTSPIEFRISRAEHALVDSGRCQRIVYDVEHRPLPNKWRAEYA